MIKQNTYLKTFINVVIYQGQSDCLLTSAFTLCCLVIHSPRDFLTPACGVARVVEYLVPGSANLCSALGETLRLQF